MKYIIDRSVADKYPEIRVGVLVGRGLTVAKDSDDLRRLIKENIQGFLNRFQGDDFLQHPNILAWRETYASFGAKPKKYRPTAEALLRRVVKDGVFPNINTAVDAYLAVEVVYLLPIGGYDLAKVEGDIVLRMSEGGQVFYPLGGGEPEHTDEGEVIYSDAKSVLTRRWNYRDADHTKITENSKDIILASEAAYCSISADDLEGTVKRMVEYESRFCGGLFSTHFLDASVREIEI
jgi:DNA/RNA-binding domain of Phe-tRNA-synthetase-like protein